MEEGGNGGVGNRGSGGERKGGCEGGGEGGESHYLIEVATSNLWNMATVHKTNSTVTKTQNNNQSSKQA